MQIKIFQAFICYNFDYGLAYMNPPHLKLEYCEKVIIAVSHNHQNYNKGLKYFTLHVMSPFTFKLNY